MSKKIKFSIFTVLFCLTLTGCDNFTFDIIEGMAQPVSYTYSNSEIKPTPDKTAVSTPEQTTMPEPTPDKTTMPEPTPLETPIPTSTPSFVGNEIKDTPEIEDVIKTEPTNNVFDYITQPPLNYDIYKEYVLAKGLYLSANSAGISDTLDARIDFIEKSELNAIVIDVKDDFGNITFKNKIDIADELGVSVAYISDIDEVIKKLKDKNIYTIARISVFKDKAIFDKKPEFVTKLQDGSYYWEKDGNGNPTFCWLDPYNKDVWDYIIDIAIGAAKVGFEEIQFDYIRFPTDAVSKLADYGDTDEVSKIDIILEFSRYAVDRLKPYGVTVSADVFGAIIISDLDASLIGQDFVEMAKIFDVICPMLYPSHYANKTFGIENPDLEPYTIISKTLELANKKLEGYPPSKIAAIRPWLQDFTATWLKAKTYKTYGGKEIQDQIRACHENGVEEWLLWDPSNRYNGALDGGVAMISDEQEE